MTTGYDIQKYNTCIIKAQNNNIEIRISGDWFDLYTKGIGRKTTGLLGRFPNVETVYSYLCGYEVGKASLKLK